MAPNDPVQLDHERRIRRLEEARLVVENTLLAVIELDRSHNERHERWKTEMEQVLSEMGEKLNGLIGWAEGSIKPKPPGGASGPQA
jgi:hypothetical protein